MNNEFTDCESNSYNLVKPLFLPQKGEMSQFIVSFSIVHLMPYYNCSSVL